MTCPIAPCWWTAVVRSGWRFSVDPSPVPWSTHETWWSRSIASNRRILLVACSGESDPGVLRYDLDGSTATVSIYLDPGLGTLVLREGTALLAASAPSIDRIHAVILPENVASVRPTRKSQQVDGNFRDRSGKPTEVRPTGDDSLFGGAATLDHAVA